MKLNLTPVYHPEANPVERKNRDLKAQLSILVGQNHTTWAEQLPSIRFAMNTARCQSTGYSAAYLTFGRELRTPDDVNHDLRAIIRSENFIPDITPKLLQLAETLQQAREVTTIMQNRNHAYTDKKRRPDPGYAPNDKVWVSTHAQSNQAKQFTSKFAPKRDGPYVILRKKGPASYEIAHSEKPTVPMGTYHTSLITPFTAQDNVQESPLPTPLLPIRKRGRPRKVIQNQPVLYCHCIETITAPEGETVASHGTRLTVSGICSIEEGEIPSVKQL